MKFPATTTSNFEIAPAGNHVGICNAIVDLGLQPGSALFPDPKHQVYLRFELPTEQISYEKDGQTINGPMSIGRTFTASMHEKANLRKFIESWFGKTFQTDGAAEAFDLKGLLGRRCLLNVTHKETANKTYANIQNATPIPKGMSSTETQHNPSLYYALETPDSAVFNALPAWLQKKISERLPDADLLAPPKLPVEPDDFDDPIPY